MGKTFKLLLSEGIYTIRLSLSLSGRMTQMNELEMAVATDGRSPRHIHSSVLLTEVRSLDGG